MLQKAAMYLFAELLSPDQVHKLKREFEKMDKDQSGFISLEELDKAVLSSNCSLTKDELSKIIDQIDFHGNKKINYTEFIAASINL